MDNQCVWQNIISDTIIENEIILQDDYLILSADMNTMFETDKTHEIYVYYINFSWN